MFDSKRFLKRFSLQAAAVLATVGAATFAEPVFANEPTTPVTTTAGTPTTTVDAEELAVQITAVTLLEERAATFQAYAENFETELPVAREELDKTKTNLETTYSNPAATETEKLSASMAHSFATAYYEGVAEAGSHFKDLAETTTQAKDNLLQQAPNLEQEIEALPTEQKLEVYRAIRQTIEHEMALIDSERQAAQELVDQAKEAIRTADLDMPLDDYRELIKHLARVTAWSNLPELTYDYSVIDADIKALEDLLAQETGQDNGDQADTDNGSDTTGGNEQGGADTGSEEASVQLSGHQANTLRQLIDTSLLSPEVAVTVSLDELLDKLAATTSQEEAEALIEAYGALSAIAATQSKLDQIYTGLKNDYDAQKVTYETNKLTLTDATELFVNELTHQMLSTYTINVGQIKGNYPYLVQPTINESTALISSRRSGVFSELSKEKQLELLQLLHQVLSNSFARPPRQLSPSRVEQRRRFEEVLSDTSVTEEELLLQAGRYAESEAFFSPRYTYDFTDLNNRIAALTKTEDNNPTAGSTVPGQSSSDQNPSGQTNQPDQTDKTDVVGQSDLSGNTTQTNPVEKNAQTRKTETAEEGNQDNKTNQTDDVKKTVASAPVAQPAGASQAKVLPATGEVRSALLSALGLLSLVASVGVIAKKRQD